MKKITILSLLFGSSLSLFASGATSCESLTSSGCGVWWQGYALGASSDGVFAQSAGVDLSYTASFTSVGASQDRLSATFPWTVSTSTSSFDAASADWSYSPASYTSLTSAAQASTPVPSPTSFMTAANTQATNTQGSTTNIASLVPTNTGGVTTMSLFTSSGNSYSNYLAQVYGLAYGNQGSNLNYNPNAFGAADPVPEPSSYVMMAAGLGALVAYARRRKQTK